MYLESSFRANIFNPVRDCSEGFRYDVIFILYVRNLCLQNVSEIMVLNDSGLAVMLVCYKLFVTLALNLARDTYQNSV